MSFGRRLGNPPVVVHHWLVVALHEIDLYARYSPLGELVQRLFEPIVQTLPDDPEYEPDSPLPTVREQSVQIHCWIDVRQIRRNGPTLIEDDVFDSMICSKVDEELVCGGINSGLEVDTLHVQRIPPIPRDLPGFAPLRLDRRAKYL